MQRSFICILMAFAIFALGSGTLERAHNLAHEAEDARLADEHPPAHHDETNCDLHAQLHLPIASAGALPLLICMGVFVAFLTRVQAPLDSVRIVSRLTCRGPPVV